MSVPQAFARQAEACARMGSPLTAHLCRVLPGALEGDLAARVLRWPGDPDADALALRLCAALHALVLTGAAPDLARAYAAGAVPGALLARIVDDHRDHVMAWLDSPPQTNEVARSAVLIGAARVLGTLAPLPLRLLELGASAGLNLLFDRYHLGGGGVGGGGAGVVLRPDWQGARPEGAITVASRRGVDLNPLHPTRDGLRLMAYCWADQTERLARLRAALRLAADDPPRVDRGDAGAWLAARLDPGAGDLSGGDRPGGERPGGDHLTLVYHTVAAQYFPPATQAACAAALARAGAAATPRAPLAHLRMEGDGGEGAALDLTLWDGRRRDWSLGRADFHGRWVRWAPRQK